MQSDTTQYMSPQYCHVAPRNQSHSPVSLLSITVQSIYDRHSNLKYHRGTSINHISSKWKLKGQLNNLPKVIYENEMVGWHHQLYEYESEQAPGVGGKTGKSGVLQSMESQSRTQPSDWTEMNWRSPIPEKSLCASALYFHSIPAIATLHFCPPAACCLLPFSRLAVQRDLPFSPKVFLITKAALSKQFFKIHYMLQGYVLSRSVALDSV